MRGVINGAAYDNLPYSYLPYRGKWNYRRDENDKIVPNSGKYYASPEDYLNPVIAKTNTAIKNG